MAFTFCKPRLGKGLAPPSPCAPVHAWNILERCWTISNRMLEALHMHMCEVDTVVGLQIRSVAYWQACQFQQARLLNSTGSNLSLKWTEAPNTDIIGCKFSGLMIYIRLHKLDSNSWRYASAARYVTIKLRSTVCDTAQEHNGARVSHIINCIICGNIYSHGTGAGLSTKWPLSRPDRHGGCMAKFCIDYNIFLHLVKAHQAICRAAWTQSTFGISA